MSKLRQIRKTPVESEGPAFQGGAAVCKWGDLANDFRSLNLGLKLREDPVCVINRIKQCVHNVEHIYRT